MKKIVFMLGLVSTGLFAFNDQNSVFDQKYKSTKQKDPNLVALFDQTKSIIKYAAQDYCPRVCGINEECVRYCIMSNTERVVNYTLRAITVQCNQLPWKEFIEPGDNLKKIANELRRTSSVLPLSSCAEGKFQALKKLASAKSAYLSQKLNDKNK